MLKKKQSGFTIVELLIVIVIIGILAALVIVAYTGIQNRARDTRGQTDAQAIVKKAEAYAADDTAGNGKYPANKAGFGTTGIGKLDTALAGKLSDGSSKTDYATAYDAYKGWACGTSPNFTAYQVSYWKAGAHVEVYAGDNSTC